MGSHSSSRITPADLSPEVIPFPREDGKGRVVRHKTQTLHHGVLSALRDLIVQSELPPGIRLTETVLCERLKVSRTPLREALKVLSHEGLVEILPNRGARVVQLMLEDVRHLFEVIAGLESFAGCLASERITDAEICEVKSIWTIFCGFCPKQILSEKSRARGRTVWRLADVIEALRNAFA